MAERLSYDVWGKRRNVNGTDAAITATQNRGYTGHEHLDAVSLIHMNGRVYEPNLGRFTGADPIVHAAGDGQSYNRYAYVRNNPLKYTDPSGYDLWSDIVDGGRKLLQENWAERQVDRVETFMARYGETIVVVVLAAAITYASGFVLSELGGSMIAEAALLAEPGVAATSATGAGLVSAAPTAAAAVGGYAAGYMQSGGDPRVAARSALSAALLAYAGGLGSDGYGQFAARVIGGGVNGYLQTGNRKGFYRGLAAGAIPDNLGFPSAYRDIWWANLSIGIVRDGIRGSIAEDSSDGFWKGVAYGQATSAVGHLWGLASTLSLPKFQNGAFMYSANWLDGPGGVTFGNVITAGTTFMESALMVSHERDHIFNPIERALGAMYIPVHLLDLIVGNAVWALGGRCAGFFMEEWTQAHPYSSIGHYCSR